MRTSKLLTQAMTHIVNHRDEWDQSDWFCGTKACLAGRICYIAGAETEWDDDEENPGWMVVLGDEVRSPGDMAARLAHLYQWEADWLWYGQRTMPELYREVNRLERGLAPTFWDPQTRRGNGGYWVDGDKVIRIAVHRGTLYNATGPIVNFTDRTDQSTALAQAQRLADQYGPYTHVPSMRKEHEKWIQ